jgi:hypothetical protein
MRTIQEIGKDLMECINETLSANPSHSVSWGFNYVKVMTEGIDDFEGRRPLDKDELRTQILYVQNNIQHWRHPRAKELKAELKDFQYTLKN